MHASPLVERPAVRGQGGLLRLAGGVHNGAGSVEEDEAPGWQALESAGSWEAAGAGPSKSI